MESVEMVIEHWLQIVKGHENGNDRAREGQGEATGIEDRAGLEIEEERVSH